MLYLPKFFHITELVPEHVFNDRGERAWELLDPLLLESIDLIRDKFGPAIINNWATEGGDRQWSGLRTEQSPYGTQYSQHRFGRAADILLADTDEVKARQYILDCPGEFPLITGVEIGVSWLHVDVRNTKGVKAFRG